MSNQLMPWGTDRIKASIVWNEIKNKPSVVIAVVDTGVDIEHPDLKENIYKNPSEIAGDGIDNDGNKLIDDISGWNFKDDNNILTDSRNHGTHISGTIAAVDNDFGIIGINPYAKILPLKFMDTNGLTSDAVDAVNYCIELKKLYDKDPTKGANIRVINMSFGGGYPADVFQTAIQEASKLGILLVCAAGNNNIDNDVYPFYPSAYPVSESYYYGGAGFDNVLAVMATNKNNQREGYSNYGKFSVDVGAPAQDTFSVMPNNSYGNKAGTSMATPHVSGAASLLFQYNPKFTAQDVKQILIDSVEFIPGLPVWSEGIINIEKAFIIAKNWTNNKSPITQQLTFTTNKNITLNAKLNAQDPENSRLHYYLAPEYCKGNIIIYKNGDFSYTPKSDYLGTDDFYFTVTDTNGKTSTNKVIINIIEPIINPEPSKYIDLTNITTYGHKRDQGFATVNDNELSLTNKAWKSIKYSISISPDTILYFEFKSDTLGILQGIGFDTNIGYQDINYQQWFNLGRSKNQGLQDFKYTNIGEWQSYSIPIGQFLTGSFNFIFFIQDDKLNPNSLSYFRNIYFDTSITPTSCRFKC